MKAIGLVCFCGIVASFATPVVTYGQIASRGVAIPSSEGLLQRLAPPTAATIRRFAAAGMASVRPHTLTTRERMIVSKALESLPEVHRRVLSSHLRRLSFVDGISGEGTGLTARVDKSDMYDVTLRADLIGETLSQFLTTKDRRLFMDDASHQTVHVTGLGVDALTYVLLHEATHVVDATMGITARLPPPINDGVWVSRQGLSPELDASPVAHTRFRGEPALPAGQAGAVYEALSQSPFVSLYSTSSASEDFAELVAWRVVSKKSDAALYVEIKAADGRTVGRYHPLDTPSVRRRFAALDRFLRDLAPTWCRTDGKSTQGEMTCRTEAFHWASGAQRSQVS